MTDAVARNFNGIWVNANGGIHFDTAASRDEQQPPLKPEYMARWRQRAADAAAGRSTADPTAACVPAGFPRFLNMVFPGEILQAEHQLNWYAEFGEATVRIYLDGRARPADWQPNYYGFTVGRWEGNTLVTNTSGLRDDTLIDTTGVPHSDRADRHDAHDEGDAGLSRSRRDARRSGRVRAAWSTVKRYARAPARLLRAGVRVLRRQPVSDGADGSVELVTEEPERKRNCRERRPNGGSRVQKREGEQVWVTSVCRRSRMAAAVAALVGGSPAVLRSGRALEEIIVTAERRETSLQDTPISVAAFTAETMELKGVETLEDVANLTPNFDIKGSRGTGNVNPAYQIRGLSGGGATGERSAAMYIDGIYMPRTTGPFMNVLDIERIEVLRGPQGTLVRPQ